MQSFGESRNIQKLRLKCHRRTYVISIIKQRIVSNFRIIAEFEIRVLYSLKVEQIFNIQIAISTFGNIMFIGSRQPEKY